MGAHVFISYSHLDGEYVGRLERHLVEAGLAVWTDHGIDYGDQWLAVIADQIDGCAALVPVMSPRSRESEWVQKEIPYAQDNSKPILPLLLEGKRFLALINVQDEDVTDGQLPSTRFVDRLRTLAGDERGEAFRRDIREYVDREIEFADALARETAHWTREQWEEQIQIMERKQRRARERERQNREQQNP